MKALNYVAQIIVAILYSGLFAGICFAVNFIPLWLFFKLSLFWFILLFVFFDSVVFGVMSLISGIVSIPYLWITKNNIVAKVISAVSVVVVGIRSTIALWTLDSDYDWKLILLAVFLTIQFIYTGFMCVNIVWNVPEEN